MDAGIDLTKELFIMVAYFTSGEYFADVVNFRLPSVKHFDDVAGPTVHTGTTPRANLAFKATVFLSQGISLLLVHHSYPHSMPMMW